MLLPAPMISHHAVLPSTIAIRSSTSMTSAVVASNPPRLEGSTSRLMPVARRASSTSSGSRRPLRMRSMFSRTRGRTASTAAITSVVVAVAVVVILRPYGAALAAVLNGFHPSRDSVGASARS